MLPSPPWISAITIIVLFSVWSSFLGKAFTDNTNNDICSLCTCKHRENWSFFECRSGTMTKIPYVAVQKKKQGGISFQLWLPQLGKVQRSDFNRRFKVTDLVIGGASPNLHVTSTAFDAISESLQRLSIQFPVTFEPERDLKFPFLWSLRVLEYFKVVRVDRSSDRGIEVDESPTHEYDLVNVGNDNSEIARREIPSFPEKVNETKTPALTYMSSDKKKDASKIPERAPDKEKATQKMTASVPILNVTSGDTRHILLVSAPVDKQDLPNLSESSSRSNNNNNNNNNNNIESRIGSSTESRDNKAWADGSSDQPVDVTKTTLTTTVNASESVNTDYLLTLNREVIMSGSTFKGPVPLVLKELYIENFGITDIQWDTFLNFVVLKALGLSRNRVKDVPFVRSLLELTHLSMAHNELYHVDADVSFPLALQLLDFSHNALSWIQLDATPSLRWLDLSFNEGLHFETFWISQDTHLETLNVSHTGLNSTEGLSSVSLAAMKSLQFLGTRMPCTCEVKVIRDAVPEVLGSCASPSGELSQVWTVSAEELMNLNANDCKVKAGKNHTLNMESVEKIDNLGRIQETSGAAQADSAAATPLLMRQVSWWACFQVVGLLVHILG